MNIFRTLLILFILTSCFGCDRVTKHYAREHLPSSPVMGYFHDTVVLQYTENRGAAMSFGADFPRSIRLTIFVGMVALILFSLIAVIFWQNSLSLPAVIGLSMIAGGGLGNLVDRVVNHGRVIDFITVRLGSYQTAIFNGADIAITTGAIILSITILLNSDLRKPTNP